MRTVTGVGVILAIDGANMSQADSRVEFYATPTPVNPIAVLAGAAVANTSTGISVLLPGSIAQSPAPVYFAVISNSLALRSDPQFLSPFTTGPRPIVPFLVRRYPFAGLVNCEDAAIGGAPGSRALSCRDIGDGKNHSCTPAGETSCQAAEGPNNFGSAGCEVVCGSLLQYNFVANFYVQVLGRAASREEVLAWLPSLRPENPQGFANGFFTSAEYLARPLTLDQHVAINYLALLGRESSDGERAAWAAAYVDYSNALIDSFFGSAEFQGRIAAVPAYDIVLGFYRGVLGREPDWNAEVMPWTNYVWTTGDWMGLARGFLASAEFKARMRGMRLDEQVGVFYLGFLGRAAGAAEIQAWLPSFQKHLITIRQGFIGSPEFAARWKTLF